MDNIISFGTIITWKSLYYVYLAEIGQITYLARIIQDNNTKIALIQRYNELEKKSSYGSFDGQQKLSSPIYCFVTLSTDEFRGDIAIIHNLSNNTNTVENISSSCKLNRDDLTELKNKIIENDGIATELQFYIKTLA